MELLTGYRLILGSKPHVHFGMNERGTMFMYVDGYRFYLRHTKARKNYWNCQKYRSHW